MTDRGFSRREVENVAEEAAERAVEKFAVRIGLDPKDPLSAQQDMAFLRATRQRCQGVGARAWMVGVGVVVAGALWVMWDGLKAKLGL